MKKKGVAAVAAILVIAAAGGGFYYWRVYHKDASGQLVSSTSENAVYVDSVAAIAGLGNGTGIQERFSGTVEPQETWECKLSSDKKVKECYVEVGDEVKVGDKLFSYDTTEDEDKLAQLEIEIERTENEIETSKSQITQLQKEKEKANADDQLRYTTEILTAENTVKRNEYDLKSKNVELQQLKETIANSAVTSQLTGMIKEINDPDTATTSMSGEESAYITVIATGAYRIKGKINEQNRYSLSEGSPMLIHSRLNDGMTWTGYLSKIDWDNAISNESNGGYIVYGGNGGSSSESSSNYPFYVELENSDGLILGQHVYMEVNAGQEDQRDGIWLESYYVVEGSETEGSYVWAASDKGLLEKRAVVLGEYDEDLMKYEITEGLDEEDYIAFPVDTLEEGLPVIYNSGDSSVDTDFGEGGEMNADEFSGPDGTLMDEGVPTLPEDSYNGESIPVLPEDSSSMEGPGGEIVEPDVSADGPSGAVTIEELGPDMGGVVVSEDGPGVG